MTREEAVKRFETLLLHVDTDCVMGMETTEAINMAIKVLEQPEQLQDKCEGCYYENGMGYQCDSCARYFPDRYTSEREE